MKRVPRETMENGRGSCAEPRDDATDRVIQIAESVFFLNKKRQKGGNCRRRKAEKIRLEETPVTTGAREKGIVDFH